MVGGCIRNSLSPAGLWVLNTNCERSNIRKGIFKETLTKYPATLYSFPASSVSSHNLFLLSKLLWIRLWFSQFKFPILLYTDKINSWILILRAGLSILWNKLSPSYSKQKLFVIFNIRINLVYHLKHWLRFNNPHIKFLHILCIWTVWCEALCTGLHNKAFSAFAQERECSLDTFNHSYLLFSPSFLSQLEGTLITYQITYKTSALATKNNIFCLDTY